jgi:hypothetical protein
MAAKENLFPFRAGIEWNLGLKTFATVLLAVSSFFWMTNLDKTKTDVITFTSKVEKLGVYRTSETVKRVTESFSQIELPSMMADIF